MIAVIQLSNTKGVAEDQSRHGGDLYPRRHSSLESVSKAISGSRVISKFESALSERYEKVRSQRRYFIGKVKGIPGAQHRIREVSTFPAHHRKAHPRIYACHTGGHLSVLESPSEAFLCGREVPHVCIHICKTTMCSGPSISLGVALRMADCVLVVQNCVGKVAVQSGNSTALGLAERGNLSIARHCRGDAIDDESR
jgi:hypothetical protein